MEHAKQVVNKFMVNETQSSLKKNRENRNQQNWLEKPMMSKIIFV